MADRATEHMTIEAPPDTVWAVVVDFPSYCEWAGDLKSVDVLETDDQGRATKVRFRAAAMGHSTSYTLAYDYSDAPRSLSWVLEEGDITRKLDGTYVFEGNGETTDITYTLEVELKVPLLSFIKRRAEQRILHTALRDLRARAEALAG